MTQPAGALRIVCALYQKRKSRWEEEKENRVEGRSEQSLFSKEKLFSRDLSLSLSLCLYLSFSRQTVN